MVAWTVAVFEAVRLVEVEIGAEQLVHAHAVAVEIAGRTQRELGAVAGEPDRVSGANLVDRGLFEHVERHVDEFHIPRFGHIGGVADAVTLVERTGRHRHVAQRHQIVDVHRHVLLVEFHRRDAGFADLSALVLAGFRLVGLVFAAFLIVLLVIVAHAGQEVELLRRLAQRDGAHAVHGGHVVVLDRAQFIDRDAGCVTFAQVGGELAQPAVEVLFERVGVLGIGGFRVGALRHETILVYKGGEHLPPTAVIGRPVVDLLEQAAVGRLVERGEHVFEIRVGFFHRIPEEQVGFGEFEIVESPLVHELVTQGVEGCEHPAAAGSALVGDGPLFQFDGEVAWQRALAFVVGGGFEHARGHRGVGGHKVGPVGVEVFGVLCETFRFDCCDAVGHTADSCHTS